MKTEVNREKLELPESLSAQLRAFERRLCVMESVVGVLGGLCGILLTYALLFSSDRLWDTPVWIRGGLTLLGGIALAGFAYYWMHHWWWRRRSARELAQLVQKQYGRLGDRLLGAVELANGELLSRNISPALCRAAIRQVSGEAEKYDFAHAVPTRRPRAYGIAFFLLLVFAVAALMLAPEAGCNAMLRWAKPFACVERYTFVSIENMPERQIVPHGEDFEIGCMLAEQSRWRPIRAACSIQDQPRIEARLVDGKALFHVPGQTEPVTLSLRIGDITKAIAIEPMYRSELGQLTARVRLPVYLERSEETHDIANGRIKFLEGSTITFTGRVNRELKSAILMATDSGLGEETARGLSVGTAEQLDATITRHDLVVMTNQFATGEMAVNALHNLVFEWTDCFGMTAVEPYRLRVESVKDDPPFVECSGMAQAVAVLEDEIVNLEIAAEDDYGLQKLWVNWSSSGNEERGLSDVQGTQTVTNGSPDTRVLAGSFAFSPITAHVPEETLVTLCAYASDYFPGRKPAISLVYRIYVLSRAKHAKLILQQMEALQAKLEDISRAEEDLLDANTKLSELDPDALAADKTTEEIKEKQASEQENADQLDRLADGIEDLIKEALRNKDISEATLRRWNELMEAMKQLAGSEMKQASKALQQAGASKEKRGEQLEEVKTLEEQILAALREMEKGINDSLEDMLAKSFANRLRLAGSVERDISTTLRELLPETVGMRTEDLPADKREVLEQLVARQTQTGKEAAYIRDDLSGFFNRTRVQCYEDIYSEMVSLKMSESLDALSNLIGQNVGVKAIANSESWKDHFMAWAELLEEEGASQKKDSCEEGTPEEMDIEVLIALMRARQKEESIREQTRLLEEGKDVNRDYRIDVRKLSKMQSELAADILSLERKVRDEKLLRFIGKVGGEMLNAGMFLRKPQTDSITIAIETEIIELLSNSISSSAEGCGSMGQMLMQSMGMQPGQGAGAGPKGGGSSAGGIPEGANANVTGSTDHADAEGREIEKSGGMNRLDLPVEFRDLLEAYFNALEADK